MISNDRQTLSNDRSRVIRHHDVWSNCLVICYFAGIIARALSGKFQQNSEPHVETASSLLWYSIVSLLFKVLKNNDYILHKIESFYHHCHNRLRFVKEQSDQSLTHTTLYKIVHISIYISVNLVFRISIILRNCFLLFDNKSWL